MSETDVEYYERVHNVPGFFNDRQETAQQVVDKGNHNLKAARALFSRVPDLAPNPDVATEEETVEAVEEPQEPKKAPKAKAKKVEPVVEEPVEEPVVDEEEVPKTNAEAEELLNAEETEAIDEEAEEVG